jgi:hypothetical protein
MFLKAREGTTLEAIESRGTIVVGGTCSPLPPVR